jgi:hypothetical protein
MEFPIIEGFKQGLKNSFTRSAFTNCKEMITSQFGTCGCDQNKGNEYGYSKKDVQLAFMVSNLTILSLIIGTIILGFIAVTKICTDTTDRGKNVRLGLYALLILTGGQVGWLYILLWILKINVCA